MTLTPTSKVKAATICMLAAILSTTILPGVLAGDYVVIQNGRQINLQPANTFPFNKAVNLADAASGQNVTLEKDTLNPAFTDEPGRYFGPYVQSSLFQFTYQAGGNFSFTVHFNFTRGQIMNAVSAYWIRWPVVASDYDSMCFDISAPGTILPMPITLYGSAFPNRVYERCIGTGANFWPFFGPGNFQGFWGPVQPATGSAYASDRTGVYYKDWSGLIPEIEYNFTFRGHLRTADTTPEVWLSIERYQVEATTSFVWGNVLTGAHHEEFLPLFPAFAFNFLQGAGEGGLTSYKMPFDGATTIPAISGNKNVPLNYIFFQNRLDGNPSIQCSNYLSFYIPFTHADNVKWTFLVASSRYGFAVGPNALGYITWTQTSTRDFVLVSTPLTIGNFTGWDQHGNPFDCDNLPMAIWITANKPVTLLAAVPGAIPVPPLPVLIGDLPMWQDMNTWWQVVLSEGVTNKSAFDTSMPIWGDGLTENSASPLCALPGNCGHSGNNAIGPPGTSCVMAFTRPGGGSGSGGCGTAPMVAPIFIDMEITSGRWALVTPGLYYSTYDFGWGKAYLFPGEVNLVMFLNNGTAIGFNSVSPISTGTGQKCNATGLPVAGGLNTQAPWLGDLVCFISGLIGDVIGVLKTIWDTIWNALVALGTWIYNVLMAFVNFVIKAVTAIVDIAAQVVFSLLTAVPFILIIFVSTKGLPDLSDLKRGYRKAVRTTRRAYRSHQIALSAATRVREARTRQLEARLKAEKERTREAEKMATEAKESLKKREEKK